MEDSSIRIIDVLSDDQRTMLEAIGTPVHFPPDQAVFWEGQPSHSALLILRGNVKVTQEAADGTETILAIRGPAELIGEEGVLLAAVRSAKVTTITEVDGLDIAAEELLGFVESRSLWPLMYRAAVQRRRQADRRALQARLDVKTRLTHWLQELAEELGEETEEGCVIESTLSQQDLAAHIGASRDAVAIELRKLREAGLLSTGRHRIVLHDVKALRSTD